MTNPAVVEKQLADFDVSHGLNESDSVYTLDWSKWLKRADNADFSTRGEIVARRGTYRVATTDDTGTSFGNQFRLWPTPYGLCSIGSADYSLRKFNEGALTAGETVVNCAYMPEYTVTPVTVAAAGGTSPLIVGTCYTQTKLVCAYTANGVDYFVAFMDRATGQLIKNYQISVGTSIAGMCLVSGRYVHLFAGTSGNCKVWVFDSTSLSSTTPSPTTLTSGREVVGCVSIGAFSYVVMRNGNISKCAASTGAESATGSVAGFGTDEIHDVATDGTSLFIVGLNSTPRGLMKVVSTALATTRTVTDTDASLSAARFSVGVDSSQNATIVAYYQITVTTKNFPTAKVLTCSSAGTTFTAVQHLPCMGEISSPLITTFGPISGAAHVALIDLPQAGTGAGHSTTASGGHTVLACISGFKNVWYTNPYGYHVAATLDSFNDYVGMHSTTKGHIVNPQKIFWTTTEYEMTIGAVVRAGEGSYSIEVRRLIPATGVVTIGSNGTSNHSAPNSFTDKTTLGAVYPSGDIMSGGNTSIYDGYTASEIGCYQTPCIIAESSGAGSGVDAGTRSYTAIFDFVDAQGRRHISRCANTYSLTLASAKNVTVSFTFPTVGDHRIGDVLSSGSNLVQYRVKIYRTVASGTQYYLLATRQVQGLAASDTYIQYTDSISDASLVSGALLHRQPGTVGTALDRYAPGASTCVLRHKDRVFYAQGNTVYYSSFAVSGEAPWFNPAFSFDVPGGSGNITALGTLDGQLIIFKRDAIFVVDGDGPPENGGNGTEFSPPRRLSFNVGCLAKNTVVHANGCIMYVSSRGIERLNRNLTVDWVGERVVNTVTGLFNPLQGTRWYGSAYDPATGRAMWLIEQYGSTLQLADSPGYALVYDTTVDAWSRYIYRGYGGYGYSYYDVCCMNIGCALNGIPSRERFVFSNGSGTPELVFEEGTYDYNGTTAFFVPMTLETGYIRGPSLQGRIKITDFLVAAQRNANCTVTISYDRNYSGSYTTPSSWVWTPATTSALTLVQLEAQVPKEESTSMSFKIATSDPTPTSFGDGSQFTFFSMTARLGVAQGQTKLPAAQKG